MDRDFWLDRWDTRRIGFHQSDFNALMVKHFTRLNLAPGSHVFVPLCGKTHDIAWLLRQGFQVTGAEFSETAVRELFDALGLSPDVSEVGSLTRYAAREVVVYVGDVFDLTAAMLPSVDAVYDRAALVALPEEMRGRYVAHLIDICRAAPQFLLTFSYDQSQMDGPPFSITETMVERYYAGTYSVDACEVVETPVGSLAVPARETAWLLR